MERDTVHIERFITSEYDVPKSSSAGIPFRLKSGRKNPKLPEPPTPQGGKDLPSSEGWSSKDVVSKPPKLPTPQGGKALPSSEGWSTRSMVYIAMAIFFIMIALWFIAYSNQGACHEKQLECRKTAILNEIKESVGRLEKNGKLSSLVQEALENIKKKVGEITDIGCRSKDT